MSIPPARRRSQAVEQPPVVTEAAVPRLEIVLNVKDRLQATTKVFRTTQPEMTIDDRTANACRDASANAMPPKTAAGLPFFKCYPRIF